MVRTWTFAVVPNAIRVGLVVAVAILLLAGIPGIGSLILNETAKLQVALTIAMIWALSIIGMLLYWGAVLLQRRVIHWKN